jgi:hypothetical protein
MSWMLALTSTFVAEVRALREEIARVRQQHIESARRSHRAEAMPAVSGHRTAGSQ